MIAAKAVANMDEVVLIVRLPDRQSSTKAGERNVRTALRRES
ncbi:hypothetical protein [Rubrobacter indicoceani]|nr:hypothetical protein [Rubrobacter indicoceani]